MATTDPERERLRLAELYASQSDGELEQAAAQADELTDIAREALRVEMSKRGLGEPIEKQSGDPGELEFRDLVTVRSFWNLPEANLAKGLLELAGIESFVFDENMVGLGLYVNTVGGITLRVDRQRFIDADQVLYESVSGSVSSEESESSS